MALQKLTADTLFRGLRMRRFPAIDSLELFVTHDCNLRCRYCFVGKKKSVSMKFGTAKRAVDMLLRESRSAKAVTIVFFGGEPVLEYGLIKKVALYAEKKAKACGKQLTFHMTTNGTLIDKEKMAFFGRHKIRLLLSIDGDRQTHDKNRRTASGKGTFDTVESNIGLIKKHQSWLGVRMTVCPSETGKMFDNFLFLLRKGINQFIIEPNHTARWARRDLDEYARQWRLIADLYDKKTAEKYPLRLVYFENDFELITKANRHFWGCSGGRNGVTIAPSGDIYPCSHFLCSAEHKSDYTWLLGNVKDGISDLDARERLNRLEDDVRPKCSSCRIKDLCTGGCPSENYDTNKSVFEPCARRCEFQMILAGLLSGRTPTGKHAYGKTGRDN